MGALGAESALGARGARSDESTQEFWEPVRFVRFGNSCGASRSGHEKRCAGRRQRAASLMAPRGVLMTLSRSGVFSGLRSSFRIE